MFFISPPFLHLQHISMKILINTPQLHRLAGVANFYRGLQSHWSDDVNYFCIGPPKWGSLLALRYYLKFLSVLLKDKPDVVVVNPSMARTAIVRDFIYAALALGRGCKVVAFFHGFHIARVTGMKTMIVRSLNKYSLIYVLAGEFRNILIEWGVKTPVLLTTTHVDSDLTENYNADVRDGSIRQVLFLARITKSKGIYVALDVFWKLSIRYPYLKYKVVGYGEELEAAEQYAKDKGIPNIEFTGGLFGDELAGAYKESDCYLFTSYHEGMPTSVIEAMAFGLPVVTRPVGGLVDFFENGKMGYLVDSDSADDYMEVFDRLLSSKVSAKRIAVFNYRYVSEHFYAKDVAGRMEQEIKEILYHNQKLTPSHNAECDFFLQN